MDNELRRPALLTRQQCRLHHIGYLTNRPTKYNLPDRPPVYTGIDHRWFLCGGTPGARERVYGPENWPDFNCDPPHAMCSFLGGFAIRRVGVKLLFSKICPETFSQQFIKTLPPYQSLSLVLELTQSTSFENTLRILWRLHVGLTFKHHFQKSRFPLSAWSIKIHRVPLLLT